MGFAATQVRLLQLTSRQHRIEYQAQRIQAQKLQLSNESDRVYNAYMTALDAKKVQYKYIENDGSISYRDATFNNMFSKYNSGVQTQYALEIVNGDKAGKFYVTQTISDIFNGMRDYKGVTDTQIAALFPEVQITAENRDEYKKKVVADEFAQQARNAGSDDLAAETAYYANLYLVLIEGKGVEVFRQSVYGDDYEWLSNTLANGDVLLHKFDKQAGDDPDNPSEGAWTEVSVATDTLLQEVSDEKELKKAEATYEAENTRINKKDSQYDTLLSQTETERTAIKTEMDSLKQVRNDNIDKAFKLFS